MEFQFDAVSLVLSRAAGQSPRNTPTTHASPYLFLAKRIRVVSDCVSTSFVQATCAALEHDLGRHDHRRSDPRVVDRFAQIDLRQHLRKLRVQHDPVVVVWHTNQIFVIQFRDESQTPKRGEGPERK